MPEGSQQRYTFWRRWASWPDELFAPGVAGIEDVTYILGLNAAYPPAAARGPFELAVLSIAGVRSDPTGSYKIRAPDFTAPDCMVTIRDGRTPTATVTLDGCTPSVVPVPSIPASPTGSCLIAPPPPVTVLTGTPTGINFDTTGCDTTFHSGATPTPVQWTIVAGSIPTGMTGPYSQGTTAGHIVGIPSVPGTYDFTPQVPTRSAPPIRRT